LRLELSTPTPSRALHRPIHKAPHFQPCFHPSRLSSPLLSFCLIPSLLFCNLYESFRLLISILLFYISSLPVLEKQPVTFIIHFPRLNNSPRHLRTIEPLTSTRKINLERHFLDTHIGTTPGHLRYRLRQIAIPPPSLLTRDGLIVPGRLE
jgi:hypothetical protein